MFCVIVHTEHPFFNGNNMRIWYLAKVDSSSKEHAGIAQKFLGQMKAFENEGFETRLLTVKDGAFSGGDLKPCLSALSLRFQLYFVYWINVFREIFFCKKKSAIYLRFPYCDPWMLSLLFLLKLFKRTPIVMEIPSYPYEGEVKGWSQRVVALLDRMTRGLLFSVVDRIVTFSHHDTIFGIPTIRTSNGVDFSMVSQTPYQGSMPDSIRLIGVAGLRFWHGFDRVIEAIGTQEIPGVKVYFDIVGTGEEQSRLKELVERYQLEERVCFWGFKTGQELDELFLRADVAVSSLGLHRLGDDSFATLKSREYLARGRFIVASGSDPELQEHCDVFHCSRNDESIDLVEIYRWLSQETVDGYPVEEIRERASKRFSWGEKLSQVIDYYRQ